MGCPFLVFIKEKAKYSQARRLGCISNQKYFSAEKTFRLQQRDAGLGAGLAGGLVPDTGLHLTDVDTAQQQHAQAALADAATEMNMHAKFPQLQELPLHTPNVTFVTTQELEDKYPDLTPKERENAFVKENGTTFLMKIGAPLRSGKPHDGRAPDYDDWDLNGDLLFWNEPMLLSS